MTKFARTSIVLFALIAAACSPSETRADRTPPAATSPAGSGALQAAGASQPRIVFLGDSLTAGLGLPSNEAVPALIQSRLDAEGYAYEVVNAGVSGDTSAGGLRRLDWSLEGNVRVLVIELGANDGLRGLPVTAMKDNLIRIIATAQSRGVQVLLTGMEAPPNYGPAYTAEFRAVFHDLGKRPGVAFVPFFLEGVAGDRSLNQGDGIHPNPAGARIVAETVWGGLKPLIEKPPQ